MSAFFNLLIVCGFALVLLSSCLLTAVFGKNWNLKPFVALSSGALLAICFLDFLPHSFEDQNLYEWSSVFILLGVLIQGLADIYLVPRLSFLDRWLKEGNLSKAHVHSHTLSSGSVCSLAGCLSVCSFFDGIRLFSALTMETLVAVEMAVALFFHLLSEGFVVGVLVLSSGMKKRALFVLIFCIAGALILGALMAQLFFISFSPVLLIAFSSGILIYICFVHLLPFCLTQNQEKWFFTGLSLFFVLHFLI